MRGVVVNVGVTLLVGACAGPQVVAMTRSADTVETVDTAAIETFTGTIIELNGEPGSKSEGERWLVLVVGDERFELDNAGGLQAGERVTVRARRVAPSPYATHRPGPRLEILDVVRP